MGTIMCEEHFAPPSTAEPPPAYSPYTSPYTAPPAGSAPSPGLAFILGLIPGVGAIYMWTGNRQVGEGRMTLTESRPSELIRVNLEFLKPFAATSTAEFTFRPDGQRTAVTWSMVGHLNFVTKVVHLFVGMDRLIGANFEKGLADMKSVAEGRS